MYARLKSCMHARMQEWRVVCMHVCKIEELCACMYARLKSCVHACMQFKELRASANAHVGIEDKLHLVAATYNAISPQWFLHGPVSLCRRVLLSSRQAGHPQAMQPLVREGVAPPPPHYPVHHPGRGLVVGRRSHLTVWWHVLGQRRGSRPASEKPWLVLL